MQLLINDRNLQTLAQVKQFMVGSEAIFFRAPADIMLLAKRDELHMCLSSPVTKKIMGHEYEIYGLQKGVYSVFFCLITIKSCF